MTPEWPRISCCLLLLCCLASSDEQARNPASTNPATPQQQQPAPPPAGQPGAAEQKARESEQPVAPAPPTQPAQTPSGSSENPVAYAWQLLKTGVHADNTSTRADAVGALGSVLNNRYARQMAEAAVDDHEAAVRKAAVISLGELHSRVSIPKLESALADKDPGVVLAAAHALLLEHDESAYTVYYEIVTGQRKGSPGLIASQSAALKDPKKLAQLGFEEGIGLVPFGGISWRALKLVTRDQSWQVRAAAAKVLANDPDPASTKALAEAAGDKNPFVRQAALRALASRGDPSVLKTVELYMYDERHEVKYAAAATYLRLTAIQQQFRSSHSRTGKKRTPSRTDKPSPNRALSPSQLPGPGSPP